MKRYIIFLCQDRRPVKMVNNVPNEAAAIDIYQVAKKTFKKYHIGDYLSIEIEKPERIQGSKILRDKIIYLIDQEVLCKVKGIRKNVIYVDIVNEKEYYTVEK